MSAPSREQLQRHTRALLRDPAVAAAIDATHEQICSKHPDTDPHAVRVALLATLADSLTDDAKEAAVAARLVGTTWREPGEALDLTVSAVRHRYDDATVEARRRYDDQRRT